MRFKVEYSKVFKEHPQEVSQCLQALKKSKSKHRQTNPEDLKWEYSVCQSASRASMGNFLNNIGTRAPKDHLYFEDYFKEISPSIFVSLTCAGEGSNQAYHCTDALPVIPSTVEQWYKEQWTNTRNRQKEFKSLSVEDQAKDLANTLADLQKSKGFSSFSRV
jgi:hypothetical protein